MTAIEAIKFARRRQGVRDGVYHLMLGNFTFLSDGGYTHATTEVSGPIEVYSFTSEERAEAFGEEAIDEKGYPSWLIPELDTAHITLAL